MKLVELNEMAKAITPKHCGKCDNLIVDRNYYFYKGQYFHKGGCAGHPTTAAAPGTAPVAKPNVARVSRIAPNVDPQQAIKQWLERHDITNYKIDPATGVVDVDGDVDLDIDTITKLPVKFGVVSGSFDIGGSMLDTLEGCPKIVGRTFNCSYTEITSFAGGPEQVGAGYIAEGLTQLTTLKGLPRVVPTVLNLSGTSRITNLEGISERIGTLHLPASKFTAHNIHKMVKYVRSAIDFTDARNSSNWLGILFIEGLKDGIMLDTHNQEVLDAFNDILQTRKTVRGLPRTTATSEKEPLPYRDVLALQEKLIDMGYSHLAKT